MQYVIYEMCVGKAWPQAWQGMARHAISEGTFEHKGPGEHLSRFSGPRGTVASTDAWSEVCLTCLRWIQPDQPLL